MFGRRKRLPRMRFGRKRRMMRMMRRKRMKPELKFIQVPVYGNQAVPVAAGSPGIIQSVVTPLTITQGAGLQNRIGASLKFLRCQIRMTLEALFVVPRGNDAQPILFCRVLILQSRLNEVDLTNYLLSLNSLLIPIDYNVATVFYDRMHRLTSAAAFDSSGGQPFSTGDGATPGKKYIKKIVKFPRRVNFAPGVNDVNDPSDRLRIVFMNDSLNKQVSVSVISRTTFIDS